MSWRTVVITNRCKLDLKLGFMVVRSEDTKRILLDEISVIVIENTGVAITGCLLNELSRRKVKVIFCDEKHNPASELVPLYGAHDSAAKVRAQIEWSKDIKDVVWTAIVSEKIRQQAIHLRVRGHLSEAEMLLGYLSEIEVGDETNREGHAAKVYFNTLFGVTFSRGNNNAINAALNYGYSLILSAVNREVCACGYLTQLGLFHDNMFNNFNLSCDLMEPFRIAVDRFVCQKRFELFDSSQKHEMLEILNKPVKINTTEQVLTNAIKIYVHSVFDALNHGEATEIRFCEYINEENELSLYENNCNV